MAKYYRVIDGVPNNEVEFGGSVVYAMADKTADGRDQYILADAVVEKVEDATITDAILIIKEITKPISEVVKK